MHDLETIAATFPSGMLRRGKVRDVYDLGERLLIVATDRVSAFDVVMRQAVPDKGAILTQLTAFWLERLPACSPHHLDYVVSARRVPPAFATHADALSRRAMVVRKLRILPVECVVRGYLAGSGWAQYRSGGEICGVRLPAGLRNADRLPEPIFTPSTKADVGHDEAITFERACELAGRDVMEEARRRSLAIYAEAAALAEARGVIIADTKFEFGVMGDRLLLADEVLTPDSSRFWPAEAYRPGANPPSFDKQFLRDYLESVPWPKRPPPPDLPADVIENTRKRYVEAFERLTGTSWSANRSAEQG